MAMRNENLFVVISRGASSVASGDTDGQARTYHPSPEPSTYCRPKPFSSAMCGRGTAGCEVEHA